MFEYWRPERTSYGQCTSIPRPPSPRCRLQRQQRPAVGPAPPSGAAVRATAAEVASSGVERELRTSAPFKQRRGTVGPYSLCSCQVGHGLCFFHWTKCSPPCSWGN